MSVRMVLRRFISPETMEWAESSCAKFQMLALTVDALYSCGVGLLLYFAPDFVGNFVFGRKTDGVHWHLIRCFGAQLLAAAYMNWSLRESSETSKSASYFARITSFVVMMMLVVQCITQTPELIADWKLALAFLLSGFLVFLYGMCLMWNGWPVGSNIVVEESVSTVLFQLDSISYICIGLTWIAFPRWLLQGQVVNQLDASHELIGRLMGAFFIATFANGLHALHWSSIADRRAVITSRAICNFGILCAQVWSQWAYLDDWNGLHWVGITLFTTWTALAGLHLFVHPSVDEAEKKEKKQD